MQIQIFHNELLSQTRSIVDVAIGGSIMTKTYDEAYELMEKLLSSHHQMMYYKTVRKDVPGVLWMDAFNAICTQLPTLSKQVHIPENKS